MDKVVPSNVSTLNDCPFCEDAGFDIIGLKHHIQARCVRYAGIPNILPPVNAPRFKARTRGLQKEVNHEMDHSHD